MTALVDRFALIGRSFPSDTCESLHKAVVAARAERRAHRPGRPVRAWQATEDKIVLPKRLSA